MMTSRGKFAIHTLRVISLFSFLLILSYLLVNIELDAFDPGAFKNVGIFLIAVVGEILINLSDVFAGLGGEQTGDVSRSVIRTTIYYVLLGGMDLSDYNISLVKIGYQLLPKYFYDFYAAKEEIRSRRIDSRETRQDIKSKIIEYLKSSSIEILSPAFVNREMIATDSYLNLKEVVV